MGAHISFSENRFPVNDGETVLDCLIRNGIAVPHSCCSGVCQSCLMQASTGDVPAGAQTGLKPTFVKQALFLACQCKPAGDMTVKLPDGEGLSARVEIIRRDMLNHNVLRLHLKPSSPFACEPGQYITLVNGVGTARSYSVANDSRAEGHIELHIRLLADGLMSQFLMKETTIGTRMIIRGPAGSCFYVESQDKSYAIILAGTGTGLAPLYGIARQAIVKGHRGPIHLFHGALRADDLYLVEQLQNLERCHENLRYVPCVLNGEARQFYHSGHIEDAVTASLGTDIATVRLFLCGAPDFVKSLRRKAFLAGVRSSHIFADAFLPTRHQQSAA